MTTTQYKVKGMTCGHCVSAVTAEVGAIDGVTDVDVDLASGTVTVASTAPLDEQAVRDAVDEAGYEVTGS
ncbi:heavy-metal-associated domain-containing protein [Actinoallomurus iriomotensis]|uniref:Heavy metal transport/detoxification protein n=1 Tax=Actinoallomurus iriomotensis TaxID=478107 RepID=A0A9W6RJ75_9ACTN|nr:heavy-metal-associated domain-containing protein [Actinoallomurus iriomotensis]GLY75042.1 heavy metal transport/detoxification protein [Actinoallomurus iriomotensis]GLY83312.1 heavy metal transport/detoxification protein [Actinoallomurus iriomotensis]